MAHKSDWRDLIPGAFGSVDQQFAMHPLDEKRAIAMLRAAKEDGATVEEIVDALVALLLPQQASDEHMKEIREQFLAFLWQQFDASAG